MRVQSVRREPIVNTPEDAYRCFMRTEMDSLALGDFLFWMAEQPPSKEHKAHFDIREIDPAPFDETFVTELEKVWRNDYVDAASKLTLEKPELFQRTFREATSALVEHVEAEPKNVFEFPDAMLQEEVDPASLAAAITGGWSNEDLA